MIVGGGKTALQKLRTLQRFTRSITVLAVVVSNEVKRSRFAYIEKKYNQRLLKGFFLVYACTNDNKLNARIRIDAHKKGLLVNVVDDPENCDFISPAIYKKGSMTVAVSSDGRNVKKSVEWRNKIRGVLSK